MTDSNSKVPLLKTPSGDGITAGNNTKTTSWSRWQKSFGFQKGYNFRLWLIFGGAMLCFITARLPYLNVGGDASWSFKSNLAPGEWYWEKDGYQRFGITLHLLTCIPAGFLLPFQFIPAIRYKAMWFHRYSGRLIIGLCLLTNVGALLIARRAFGGSLASQTAIGLLAICTTTSLSLALYNIKMLQIDQHRAWMIRATFYLGCIVTIRIIMTASVVIASLFDTYYSTMPCDELFYIYDGAKDVVLARYPACAAGGDTYVAVLASVTAGPPESEGAILGMSFAMGLWLALFLHLVGVEIYLALTPKEADRLRHVSYDRQLKAGFQNPGSAGFVIESFGDADPWVPKKDR